jgi:hypothetical protein
MIEGTLKDASLPGLIQFLAAETNRLYRVILSTGGQTGELYLMHGCLIHASFSLLTGEDALCEFLSWRDGSFAVERLAAEFESTVKKNINLRMQGPSNFVAQSAFLHESNIGLNTTLVPSKNFGSLEWQDAVRTQPLEREDFIVLGWLKDGRSLRQAAREFNFDIVKATGVLFRLHLTHSVQVLRSGSEVGEASISEAAALKSPEITGARSTSETKAKRRSQGDSKTKLPQAKKEAGKEAPAVKSGQSGQPAAGAVVAGGGGGRRGAITASLPSMAAIAEASAYLGKPKNSDGKEAVASETAASPASFTSSVESTIDCAPDVVAQLPADAAPETEPGFSARRTEALPLVTIDIERLLQAVFTATQFGKMALNNQALDQHLRQTLLDVEAGKSLQLVTTSSVRNPASVLSTYRFCLARGYIISVDPVVPLTADLLLGRIEIDQYLLQRRRINGDELRDLIEIQRQSGGKLADLLVKHGYLTAGDLTRLVSEQKRFALT